MSESHPNIEWGIESATDFDRDENAAIEAALTKVAGTEKEPDVSAVSKIFSLATGEALKKLDKAA